MYTKIKTENYTTKQQQHRQKPAFVMVALLQHHCFRAITQLLLCHGSILDILKREVEKKNGTKFQ